DVAFYTSYHRPFPPPCFDPTRCSTLSQAQLSYFVSSPKHLQHFSHQYSVLNNGVSPHSDHSFLRSSWRDVSFPSSSEASMSLMRKGRIMHFGGGKGGRIMISRGEFWRRNS